MADTEKITINMNMVDLGKIDLLVEEGFYSNRTDFIRAAIRRQLDQHDDTIRQSVTRKTLAMGVVSYSGADLEQARKEGRRMAIRVMGLLILDRTVSPELARETIESVKVYGVINAPANVKEALQDRIH